MLPVDPFGFLSDPMWEGLKAVSAFLRQPLEPLGLASPIFANAWPLAYYLAVYAFVTLLCAVALGYVQGIVHLGRAFLAALLTGASGAFVWTVNQELIDANKLMVAGIVTPGIMVEPQLSQPPFPNAGSGWGAMWIYLIYWVLLGALSLLKAAAWLGQDVIGGVIIIAIGLMGIGEIGRRIFQWMLMAYVVCFILGMPTVALAMRLAQAATSGIDNKVMATIVSITAILLALGLLALVFWASQKLVARITNGRVRSSVEGHTDTDIVNDPDVRALNDEQVTTTSASIDVSLSETSQDDTPFVVTDDALSSGGVIIGRSPSSDLPELPRGTDAHTDDSEQTPSDPAEAYRWSMEKEGWRL